ncbi:GTPase [Ignavibacterium sp.]|uniref:GTPase n=1 Tax=Ignavibacterium sp. TaxID=2651167 RepID=UPI00307FC48A
MNKYLNTLKECSKIAAQEYKEVSKKLKKIKKDLTSSQNVLVDTLLKLDESDINDKAVYDSINEINNKTSELLKNGFDSFENSFSKKADNLSDFTVTLFGRTKAGKSTIREALTNGDGSTIGKGAQRTTRDVKTYNWNHLRIIDTPGFDAYKGEEDEKIAFSQVDETDLILFLVTSDSIEESEFEKLASLRRENKPVIILLNVLYDLKHPIKKKQFLKNPKNYVSINAIRGYLSRLKFLSNKHFDIQNISVIPIHALSAYETNNSEGNEKKYLYDASNFKYFSDYLTKEIETSGKQKRVQSFRDSYIFHLENSIKPVYEDSLRSLTPIVRLLRNKQFELKNWFDKLIPDKNDEIERIVEKIFEPLFNQLDYFVDQNIENSDFGDKWNNMVSKYITENKFKSVQENIVTDMNRYLEEFFKEFKFDLNLSVSKIKSDEISGVKKGSTGKVVRWSGAAVGTASAVILSAAVANSWNPLGWGLAIVGIGLGIFSWFWGDDTKRFNIQKAIMKTRMFNNLEKMQRKNKGALKTWFYNDITHGLKKKITQDLDHQVELFQKLLKEYSAITAKIDSFIEKENIELIKRLLDLHHPNGYESDNIHHVARVQGVLTKILIENTLFNGDKNKNDFMKIYGERIIEIKSSTDKMKFLLDSLIIDSSEIIDAFFSDKENKFVVRVDKRKAGKIYGHLWSNVRTAEKIIGNKIHIEVV